MENKAEGIIEKDELPIIPGTNPTPEEKPIEEKPVEDKPTEVVMPANIESDENIPFLKNFNKPAEEKPAAINEPIVETTIEDIFSPELLDSVKIEEAPAKTENFWTEILNESKEILGDIEVTTPKEFIEKVKGVIDTAKQVVEIDTSKYTTEQIALHKHLSTEKGLKEFADIADPYLRFLALNDDQKMKAYLKEEKGMKDDEIADEFDRLLENDEWNSTIDMINNSIVALKDQAIQERVNKVTEDYQTIVNNNQKIIDSEKNELVKVLNETNEFMGYTIPETFKSALIKEIENGQFTQRNNNAPVQVKARLFDLIGERILTDIQKKQETIKDEAYNRGLEKGLGQLHNKPIVPEFTGHQKMGEEKNTAGLEGFKNIDKDSIKT